MKKKSRPKIIRHPVKKIEVLTNSLNYKNPEVLKKFLSPRFKLLPRKLTGLTAKKQRILERELKRARIMALLPFTDRHAIN